MTTRFCIVRHGETDWNVERRLQGSIDIELNAVGRAQAEAVRPGLAGHAFSAAYSSDLARAWRTAQIATAGLGLAVSPAPTLRERHYGGYEGLTASEAAARFPATHHRYLERHPDYDCEGGETLAAFAARVMSALAGLAAVHPGGSVLIFTHGGVLDVIYRAAVGRPLHEPRDFPIPNAALNWVACRDGRWELSSWADRRHLERGAARALDEVAE